MGLSEKLDRICKGCEGGMVKQVSVNHPFFRHLDFTTISKSGCLYKCLQCQTVFNPDAVVNETPTFETETYAASRQTEHTIKVDEFPEPVTRSFLQAKILVDNIIQHDQPKILDIGCFDGRLLLELDDLLVAGHFWGFDINPHLEALFPDRHDFHFLSSLPDDLDSSFDLIIMSHSILYIPDLSKLMFTINKLLKSDGILYIQIPDINKNPFYALMGDQCYIFTEKSLRNVLKHYGFVTSKLDSKYFPRELVLVAKKNKTIIAKAFVLDTTVENTIEILEGKRKKLLNVSGSKLSVLGTTINAAYVDEVLRDRIWCFLDENLEKIGTMFRGKNVLNPKQLTREQDTILPYGETGHMIEKRFKRLYKGVFSVV